MMQKRTISTMCCGCTTSKCTGSSSCRPPRVPLSSGNPGMDCSETGGPPPSILGGSGRLMLGVPGNQIDTPFTCLSKYSHKYTVHASVLGDRGTRISKTDWLLPSSCLQSDGGGCQVARWVQQSVIAGIGQEMPAGPSASVRCLLSLTRFLIHSATFISSCHWPGTMQSLEMNIYFLSSTNLWLSWGRWTDTSN